MSLPLAEEEPCFRTIGVWGDRACPELSILATSREALGVEGETVHAVPTLALPPADLRGAAAHEAYESVRLYVERAKLVVPDFRLVDANASVIGEIAGDRRGSRAPEVGVGSAYHAMGFANANRHE